MTTNGQRTRALLALLVGVALFLALSSGQAEAASRVIVTDVVPEGNADGVAADSNVTATFNKAMKPSTLRGTTFYVRRGGLSTAIPARVSYSRTSKTATLNPDVNLEAGATYTAAVKGGERGVKASDGALLRGTRDSTATLKNTIVANSTGGANCSGTITDGGYNMEDGTSCSFSSAKNSRPSVEPMLGPLAHNGGPTPTHALQGESPAVDKGRSFGVTTDQRGLPRPFDLGPIANARRGDGADIGAYEQLRCSGVVVNAAGGAVVGTPRSEDLVGTPGDDTIFGLGGNDTIFGLGGNDDICSGKGDDTVEGGGGDDTVEGGEGKDRLRGDPGDDELRGLRGEDRLNAIDGVQRNDVADGGPSRDVCKTDSKSEKLDC